jgi:DNA-binding HxlR family transcriptional regulator
MSKPKSKTQLEEQVLVTLSFYEAMTFSQIILDFDSTILSDYPDFDKEMLSKILKELESKKLIKKVKIDKEMGWIRVLPKRSWWKRLFPL